MDNLTELQKLYLKKRDFFERELALTSDPATKFNLQEKISEINSKLKELNKQDKPTLSELKDLKHKIDTLEKQINDLHLSAASNKPSQNFFSFSNLYQLLDKQKRKELAKFILLYFIMLLAISTGKQAVPLDWEGLGTWLGTFIITSICFLVYRVIKEKTPKWFSNSVYIIFLLLLLGITLKIIGVDIPSIIKIPSQITVSQVDNTDDSTAISKDLMLFITFQNTKNNTKIPKKELALITASNQIFQQRTISDSGVSFVIPQKLEYQSFNLELTHKKFKLLNPDETYIFQKNESWRVRITEKPKNPISISKPTGFQFNGKVKHGINSGQVEIRIGKRIIAKTDVNGNFDTLVSCQLCPCMDKDQYHHIKFYSNGKEIGTDIIKCVETVNQAYEF